MAVTVADIEVSNAGGEKFQGFVDVNLPGVPSFVMFTNNDCLICRKTLQGGFEPIALRLWIDRVRRSSFAFDIGAHTGIYTLAAGNANPRCVVHSFEPMGPAFYRLILNIEANGQQSHIRAHNIGITHRNGPIKLLAPRRPYPLIDPCASIATGDKNGFESFSAIGRTLDSLINDDNLNGGLVMKIDVENAEGQVLNGGEALIKKHRPDMFIELLGQKRVTSIGAWLEAIGYKLYHIDEITENITAKNLVNSSSQEANNSNWFATCDQSFGP
jgi:FkbM family methyltransferase